jgi:hypothetical protein
MYSTLLQYRCMGTSTFSVWYYQMNNWCLSRARLLHLICKTFDLYNVRFASSGGAAQNIGLTSAF